MNVRIDWITCTFKHPPAPYGSLRAIDVAHYALNVFAMPFQHEPVVYLGRPPVPRYDAWFEGAGGVLVGVSDPRTTQGCILVARGKALSSGAFSARTALESVDREGWKVTRLDVAADFEYGEKGYYSAEIMKDLISPSLKDAGVAHSFFSSNDGDTFYIGSRSSGRFIRFYDKDMDALNGKPLQGGVKGLRIEIEMKGEFLQRRIASLMGNAASALYWVIEAALNMPDDTRQALESVKDGYTWGVITTMAHQETSTERWLFEQVLPALRKLALREPALLATFAGKVNGIIDNMLQ